jgi:hypothetical protein
MSEIRKKIHDIWAGGHPEAGFQELMDFIESHYVPREEHEKAEILLDACRSANESYFKEIQQLKENRH